MSINYSENWYPAYEDLLNLKTVWPFQVEDLFNGKSKYPMFSFRYGNGAVRIIFIARIHGHEPAGTSGTIAFLRTLAAKQDSRLQGIAERFTIDIIPLVNVDAALRYADLIPDSYAKNKFEENDNDYLEYKNIMTSPGRDLFGNLDMRKNHLEASTLDILKVKGITLGTLYNEEGIEIARDWEEQNSSHVRTLINFLQNNKTDYFIDIHCHERPTTLYIPYTKNEDKNIQYMKKCGKSLLNHLRHQNIPCTPKKSISSYVVHGISNDYVYNTMGINSFLWEINAGYKFPPSFENILKEDYKLRSLTRNEMTKTVFELMLKLIENLGKTQ